MFCTEIYLSFLGFSIDFSDGNGLVFPYMKLVELSFGVLGINSSCSLKIFLLDPWVLRGFVFRMYLLGA